MTKPIKVGDYVYVHNARGVCTGAGKVLSIQDGVARYKRGPGLYGQRQVAKLERHPQSDNWNKEGTR